MKKLFLLVLFLTPTLFSQQSSNGNITLVYNGEKIDLPINSITIQKEKGILLSIEAERKDAKFQQRITLEIGLKELSSLPAAETLAGTRVEISTRDNTTDSGKELSFRFSEEENNQPAFYGVSNGGNKSIWKINSVSMKLDITDVKYVDGVLHLTGEYSGTFKSSEAPEGEFAEIRDGRFEIII